MRKWIQKIPSYVRRFFLLMSVPLVLLTICRILFYLYNISYFPNASFLDFFTGVWFDLMTLGIVFIPFYILYFFPIHFRDKKAYFWIFRILYHISLSFIFIFNLLDIAYFEFTSKRSTADLISLFEYGEDVNNLMGTFLLEYWFLFLFLLLIIIGNDFWFRFSFKKIKPNFSSLKIQIPLFPIFVFIFFLIGRGGWQLKPSSIITASKYTTPENVPLVLNSAFTIIKTWNKGHLESKDYMSTEKAQKLFNPVQQFKTTNIKALPENTNVVILIMESVSNEFIGKLSGSKTYTPFLDSLFDQGLLFTKAYANGKKSIEALPAITASLPSLMEAPYISSSYSGNKIEALPTILKEKGYKSAFYHAATNGSMNFDGYASLAGYDDYYGRKEYDNDNHYDGTWGIYDEYFLPWTAQKMSQNQTPFLATIFTISSHHPYKIPAHHGSRFETGDGPIFDATMYGDYTIQQFFETAKKQDWYQNTLFIITADHSPSSRNEAYNRRESMYRVPIFFYHPTIDFSGKEDVIAQQADIMPSILDLLAYKESFFAFGNSLFRENDNRFSISLLSGIYNFIYQDFILLFADDESIQFYNYEEDRFLVNDLIERKTANQEKAEQLIKAYIQQYNEALIKNKTSIQ